MKALARDVTSAPHVHHPLDGMLTSVLNQHEQLVWNAESNFHSPLDAA